MLLLLLGLLAPFGFAGKPTKSCAWNGTVAALEDNCTLVTGNDIILGAENASILYSKLAYVESISGCVQITQSNYERLDFFARLRSVSCTQTGNTIDLNIVNNTALKRLGMPVLRVNRLALMSNPQLCMTPEEQQRYTYVQRGPGDNATVCLGQNGPIHECSSQQSQANAGLGDDCEIILGSLFIDGTSNQNITNKLQYIREVNGRLYIRNTDLSALSMPLLEKIYAAEAVSTMTNDPAIIVNGNANFTKLDLPKLNFISKSEQTLVGDSFFKIDQPLCNAVSKFGPASSNGTVCTPNAAPVSAPLLTVVTLLTFFSIL